MSNPMITFLGWSIIPSFVAGFVQTFYYGITIRAGDPKPPVGSPRYVKHQNRIRAALIVLYLFYTFYEAVYTLRERSDFYQALGLTHDVDEKEIKKRFRRLAALHHPDKAAASGRPEVSDAYFVHLRLAQETLTKPVQRFAYDRFGPEMLSWDHCISIRDYLTTGFRVYAPRYIGSVLVLFVLGAVGYMRWGLFWRYFITSLLVYLEIYTVTRPTAPAFLESVVNPLLTRFSSFPPLLPFQFLVLARNITFTLFIGLSQLAPIFQNRENQKSNEVDATKLARLEKLSRTSETEATRLLQLEMAPFGNDGEAVKELKDKIRNWLVQNTVRADPLVREAVGEALQKRKSQ